MSDRFVIVHRSYDPIQADHLGEILRDAGIAARVNGTRSGATIGVAQNILEVHIAVPESQAGPATDFLEAYFAGEGIDDEAFADSDEDEIDESESVAGSSASDAPPSSLLVAGAAFLTFGLGHVSAKRPWTGAALASGQLLALYFLLAGQDWSDWTVGFTLLGGLVLCDLVGAVMAARAHRRGIRRGTLRQSLTGIACVAGALALAMVLGPELADPGKDTGRAHQRDRQDPGSVDNPLERTPNLPGLTSEHPANPLR